MSVVLKIIYVDRGKTRPVLLELQEAALKILTRDYDMQLLPAWSTTRPEETELRRREWVCLVNMQISRAFLRKFILVHIRVSLARVQALFSYSHRLLLKNGCSTTVQKS